MRNPKRHPPVQTVRDLIAALQRLPPSARVILAGEGDDIFLSFIDTECYDPEKYIRLDGCELVPVAFR